MKILTAIALLSMPLLAQAQTYPNMSQGDMQKLQEMMMCMNSVDQNALKALEKRQQQFSTQVKSLCKQGKRDQAQQKAMKFASEMMQNPAIKQVKKCGEMASSMLPNMPFLSQQEQDSDRHVCDSM
jgi:hypothetical protein